MHKRKLVSDLKKKKNPIREVIGTRGLKMVPGSASQVPGCPDSATEDSAQEGLASKMQNEQS